jgi:hypothetical protein
LRARALQREPTLQDAIAAALRLSCCSRRADAARGAPALVAPGPRGAPNRVLCARGRSESAREPAPAGASRCARHDKPRTDALDCSLEPARPRAVPRPGPGACHPRSSRHRACRGEGLKIRGSPHLDASYATRCRGDSFEFRTSALSPGLLRGLRPHLDQVFWRSAGCNPVCANSKKKCRGRTSVACRS